MRHLGLDFIPLDSTANSADQIIDFESKYKIMIPSDLKTLYLKYSNSLLDYPVVHCDGIDGGVMPERWTGIASNGINYIIDLYGPTIGDNVIPFAIDPGGNIFIVKMDGEDQSGVFYVNLDEVDESTKKYITYRLADNIRLFAELINLNDSNPD